MALAHMRPAEALCVHRNRSPSKPAAVATSQPSALSAASVSASEPATTIAAAS